MKKIIFISFFLLSFSGCYINSGNLNVQHTKFKSHSQSGKYLSANYSILKGDVFSANKILKSGESNLTLLELQFFSNLVSGNFEIAYNISNSSIFKNKNNFLYKIPQFAVSFKNKDYEDSLKIAKETKNFFGFNKIISLLEFWLEHSKFKTKEDLIIYNSSNFEFPVYKLLILENFYNIKQLKKIADYNLNLKSLSNVDLLFLAGYYFRLNNIDQFEKIIRNRLSDQFDKERIIKEFSSTNNIFYILPNFPTILSLYLYDVTYISDEKNGRLSSYIKIFLEMSLYFCSEMNISKYSLAELYVSEKNENIALDKLASINKKSFFSLAGNLKKLSIIKSFKKDKVYQSLLIEQSKRWPNNKFILYKLANFYKSKKNYYDALKIYEQILLKDHQNNRILFLYATCLDKLGKWDLAKKILLNLIETDINDAYPLNYLSYSLSLKNKDLDIALNLIKKAIKIDPNNGFFLDTLGWVQYQRKDYKLAVFYLEKAVTLESNSSEIINHLGDSYLMLGRINEAKYEWKKALQYETDVSIITMIKEKINKYE